ncbi:MAG: tetratricopeptide repeat protein, partial [Cyanobacteria bacterium P01_D01_bin.128]
PKFAYPHDNLGDVYRDQGRYDDAIAAYQQAINLDPKDAYPYNGLGDVYRVQGRYDDAIAAYIKAIELDSKYAYSKLSLGLVHALECQMNEANQLWLEGRQLLGEDVCDRLHYGLYSLALGESESGLALIQTLIRDGAISAAIKGALDDATILARCPMPPEGIEQVISLLQTALNETPSSK